MYVYWLIVQENGLFVHSFLPELLFHEKEVTGSKKLSKSKLFVKENFKPATCFTCSEKDGQTWQATFFDNGLRKNTCILLFLGST